MKCSGVCLDAWRFVIHVIIHWSLLLPERLGWPEAAIGSSRWIKVRSLRPAPSQRLHMTAPRLHGFTSEPPAVDLLWQALMSCVILRFLSHALRSYPSLPTTHELGKGLGYLLLKAFQLARCSLIRKHRTSDADSRLARRLVCENGWLSGRSNKKHALHSLCAFQGVTHSPALCRRAFLKWKSSASRAVLCGQGFSVSPGGVWQGVADSGTVFALYYSKEL